MKIIPGIGMTVHYDVPNMEKYGSYAVIIDDEWEFISRIERESENRDIYTYAVM